LSRQNRLNSVAARTTDAEAAGGAPRRALTTLWTSRSSRNNISACSAAARSAVCVLSVRGSLPFKPF
jgi:hypothetical protein